MEKNANKTDDEMEYYEIYLEKRILESQLQDMKEEWGKERAKFQEKLSTLESMLQQQQQQNHQQMPQQQWPLLQWQQQRQMLRQQQQLSWQQLLQLQQQERQQQQLEHQLLPLQQRPQQQEMQQQPLEQQLLQVQQQGGEVQPQGQARPVRERRHRAGLSVRRFRRRKRAEELRNLSEFLYHLSQSYVPRFT